ncbi:MAG: TldD/PmbA family protein [Acidimicrobiales bacterium]
MIEDAVVARVLNTALRTGGDFAELFVEDRRSSSARLDDGRVEELTSGRDRGAGIRVVRGETTGFAHTSDLTDAGLLAAAEAAGAAARGGGDGVREVAVTHRRPERPSRAEVLPEDVPKAVKVELLKRAEDAARSEDGAIRQVAVTYGDGRRRFLVANSDGLVASEDQVRTRTSVSVVARNADGVMQTGYETAGGTVGFEIYDKVQIEDVARVAARRAADLLKARPAPSGQVPVVLRKGGGGILFHEACGHGLESDLVGRDASVFRDKVGERVASPLVTLVDDGSYVDEWGSYGIDDEGHAARRNMLIQDGELTDYMWDFVRARKEGRESSGNGRRQSYQHLPMVRMTNTYVLAGEEDPEEIIRQTPYGIYCVQLGGGQVNTATGDFVFGMTEAYLIEDGVVTAPLRAANLIGNGPEVLRSIDALGNDFETWAGTCGKDGQGVPVSSGQPTLRVASMTVGGTGG